MCPASVIVSGVASIQDPDLVRVAQSAFFCGFRAAAFSPSQPLFDDWFGALAAFFARPQPALASSLFPIALQHLKAESAEVAPLLDLISRVAQERPETMLDEGALDWLITYVQLRTVSLDDSAIACTAALLACVPEQKVYKTVFTDFIASILARVFSGPGDAAVRVGCEELVVPGGDAADRDVDFDGFPNGLIIDFPDVVRQPDDEFAKYRSLLAVARGPARSQILRSLIDQLSAQARASSPHCQVILSLVVFVGDLWGEASVTKVILDSWDWIFDPGQTFEAVVPATAVTRDRALRLLGNCGALGELWERLKGFPSLATEVILRLMTLGPIPPDLLARAVECARRVARVSNTSEVQRLRCVLLRAVSGTPACFTAPGAFGRTLLPFLLEPKCRREVGRTWALHSREWPATRGMAEFVTQGDDAVASLVFELIGGVAPSPAWAPLLDALLAHVGSPGRLATFLSIAGRLELSQAAVATLAGLEPSFVRASLSEFLAAAVANPGIVRFIFACDPDWAVVAEFLGPRLAEDTPASIEREEDLAEFLLDVALADGPGHGCALILLEALLGRTCTPRTCLRFMRGLEHAGLSEMFERLAGGVHRRVSVKTSVPVLRLRARWGFGTAFSRAVTGEVTLLKDEQWHLEFGGAKVEVVPVDEDPALEISVSHGELRLGELAASYHVADPEGLTVEVDPRVIEQVNGRILTRNFAQVLLDQLLFEPALAWLGHAELGKSVLGTLARVLPDERRLQLEFALTEKPILIAGGLRANRALGWEEYLSVFGLCGRLQSELKLPFAETVWLDSRTWIAGRAPAFGARVAEHWLEHSLSGVEARTFQRAVVDVPAEAGELRDRLLALVDSAASSASPADLTFLVEYVVAAGRGDLLGLVPKVGVTLGLGDLWPLLALASSDGAALLSAAAALLNDRQLSVFALAFVEVCPRLDEAAHELLQAQAGRPAFAGLLCYGSLQGQWEFDAVSAYAELSLEGSSVLVDLLWPCALAVTGQSALFPVLVQSVLPDWRPLVGALEAACHGLKLGHRAAHRALRSAFTVLVGKPEVPADDLCPAILDFLFFHIELPHVTQALAYPRAEAWTPRVLHLRDFDLRPPSDTLALAVEHGWDDLQLAVAVLSSPLVAAAPPGVARLLDALVRRAAGQRAAGVATLLEEVTPTLAAVHGLEAEVRRVAREALSRDVALALRERTCERPRFPWSGPSPSKRWAKFQHQFRPLPEGFHRRSAVTWGSFFPARLKGGVEGGATATPPSSGRLCLVHKLGRPGLRCYLEVGPSSFELALGDRRVRVARHTVEYVLKRTLNGRATCVEVFTSAHRSLLVEFQTEAEVGAALGLPFTDVARASANLARLWHRRKLSSFELLVSLSVLSGRSFNALSLYPELPALTSSGTVPPEFFAVLEFSPLALANRHGLESEDFAARLPGWVAEHFGLTIAARKPAGPRPRLPAGPLKVGARLRACRCYGRNVHVVTDLGGRLIWSGNSWSSSVLPAQRSPAFRNSLGGVVAFAHDALGAMILEEASIRQLKTEFPPLDVVVDGQLVAVAFVDQVVVHVFDGGRLLVAIRCLQTDISCLAVSELFHVVAVGCSGRVLLYDLPTGRLLRSLVVDGVPRRVLVTDGWGFIVANVGELLCVWTLNGLPHGTQELTGRVTAWAPHTDLGGFDWLAVATSTSSGTLLRTGEVAKLPLERAVELADEVIGVDFASRSNAWIVATQDGTLHFVEG
jgi:hypothetical protein